MQEQAIRHHRDAASVVELVRRRSLLEPERLAFRYLREDGESIDVTLAELDLRARAVAASIQAAGGIGERVLILCPPGPEFLLGLVGCMYAGAVAVPAHPPDPARPERSLRRLRVLLDDSTPRVILGTSLLLPPIRTFLESHGVLADVRWLACDDVDERRAEDWEETPLAEDSLAFLQYTSGSTSDPKGVALSHGNLLHHSDLLDRASSLGSLVGVFWLPPFHDMGLIGGFLAPLCLGSPTIMMPPQSFLQRPLRWLQAIASVPHPVLSGGPTFGYDLCIRRTTPEERSALDLSRWEVAFVGAEPVRAQTLASFAEAFACAGFRRRAFYPTYGLAEATLMVSAGRPGRGPMVRSFSARELERGVARPAAPDEASVALVGCGRAQGRQQVLVVDPDGGSPLGEGRIGEIWVSGPSVARGYWGRSAESDRVFRARPAAGSERCFLRTGDLGFLADGELFITGRIKDVINVRGRNLYPQDLELTAERAHPKLRRGGAAAFAVARDGEDAVIVVQEADVSAAEAAAIEGAVRAAVIEAHGIAVREVVLIEPRTIPKTSSGKIQRRATREAYLQNELKRLGVARARGEAEESARAACESAVAVVLPPDRPLLAGDRP
jgi:acyl-CoA synthetase (AMP-forming)/AMP-acid ligase II